MKFLLFMINMLLELLGLILLATIINLEFFGVGFEEPINISGVFILIILFNLWLIYKLVSTIKK